jgi:hypothetical protein
VWLPLRLPFLVGLGATLVAAVFTRLVLPDEEGREREPWRIELPRVPSEIRFQFLRVMVTAATVWAAVALYLSIVPSYAADLLGTQNLALLGAISALPLVSSFVTQILSQRRRLSVQLSQAIGLGLLSAGLLTLVLTAPLHSLPLLLFGALTVGAGHGIAFLNAQEELNGIAPSERRGEVTAAFISGIYFLVAAAVIATGVLDLHLSLTAAVWVVSVCLIAVALSVGAWQARCR